MDPKKMQGMMKQLGIKQEEVASKRVVIEKEDGGKIIIEEPSVVKINMQGQDSWQIMGNAHEEEARLKEDDVKLVMEKTGKSEEEAKKALEAAGGEVAQAIVDLSE